MNKLDCAIKKYLEVVTQNNFDTYAKFEVEKLALADAFLESIGHPKTILWQQPVAIFARPSRSSQNS